VKIDVAELGSQIRRWAADHPDAPRLDAAFAALHEAAGKPGSVITTAEQLEALALSLLRNHEGFLTSIVDDLEGTLSRLLEDLGAEQAGLVVSAERSAARQRDLEALRRTVEGVDSFAHQAPKQLTPGSPASKVEALRDQLAGTLKTRSPVRGSKREAIARLYVALATEEGNVTEAARRLIGSLAPQQEPTIVYFFLPGGRRVKQRVLDPSAAVKHLLTYPAGLERDRALMAVLAAAGALVPGKGLGGAEWARFQRLQTGLHREWTGVLRTPVRGYETIGIDGFEGGFVLDAKLTAAFEEASGHLYGRVELPRGEPEIQKGIRSPWPFDPASPLSVVEEMKRSIQARPSVAELNAWRERFGIAMVGEMERQLAFARENGLAGVRWVCSTHKVKEAFEKGFADRFLGWGQKIEVVVRP
jgi:hypothetical protein